MRTGRPKAELMLTTEERHTLEQWTRRPKTAQALARRARVVLACATGKTNHVVAAEFKTTGQTVGRWRDLEALMKVAFEAKEWITAHTSKR